MKALSSMKIYDQPISSRLGSILLYGVFGLLMFGPLAFGAVEPWSIFLVESGASLLLLLWVARQLLDGGIKLRANPLFLPMAAFAALILFQIAVHATAYRHDSINGAMILCAYAMLCFLLSQTLLRSSQAKKLAVILCIYGCAVAALALLGGVAPNGKLYWLREPRMGGWIYGPYVNHNHYAGLMEMLIPIPLVLALTQMARKKERLIAAAGAALMAGTIFLSGSRGGMLALLVELMLLGVIAIRKQKGMRLALIAATFLVILGGLSIWLGGAELGHRIFSVSSDTRSEISGDMRWNIDRDGFRMFLQHPLTGWGLGTFPVVYPQFRSFYTNFFVNQAHNDYLQLLVETGLLGFGIMIWFLVVFYRQAWKKIANWTSDVGGAVSLACILGVTGILVHSALDFNLQIPANAALFYALCTVGAAKPFAQPMRKRKPVKPPAREMVSASQVV
ncbi:MAG TPA: O-antigen ligase family protein [Candidatus Sulfotelmatobacter sp.]